MIREGVAIIVEEPVVRSPLYENQKDRGAIFSEFFGRLMAEAYSGHLKEHHSVRESVGLIDLTFYGAIMVGGKESAQFLNGLVTNDVKPLTKGKCQRAAFLTGHGKVKALCRIFGLGECQYLIINDPQTHESVFKYIFPFSYAGDFQVEDCSDKYRILSIQGPKSLLVMKEICFEPVPALTDNEWIETLIAGHQVMVAFSSHTGEPGYDIMVPVEGAEDVWDFILMKGRNLRDLSMILMIKQVCRTIQHGH